MKTKPFFSIKSPFSHFLLRRFLLLAFLHKFVGRDVLLEIWQTGKEQIGVNDLQIEIKI
jgi:hypothetical protein